MEDKINIHKNIIIIKWNFFITSNLKLQIETKSNNASVWGIFLNIYTLNIQISLFVPDITSEI